MLAMIPVIYMFFVVVVTAFRWFAQVSLSPHKFVLSHGCCYRSYESKLRILRWPPVA